jgi:hypothetical protein
MGFGTAYCRDGSSVNFYTSSYADVYDALDAIGANAWNKCGGAPVDIMYSIVDAMC